MDSDKRLEYFNKYLIASTLVVAIVKIIISTLTLPDVLALILIPVISLAARVVDYKYPKRPDLFSEIELLNIRIHDVETKTDELESDMTGVKFGLKQRS